MSARKPRKKRSYHHGDLKAALIDSAVTLIGEKGVRGFSMAEASRSLGVTVGAPFKHFASRDELLVAVAIRACGVLSAALASDASEARTPAEQLAALARAFVRFAALHRPLFETLFAAGLDKARDDLAEAARPIEAAFVAPAQAICGDGEVQELIVAVIATAHGFAGLLLEGAFGDGEDAVEVATSHTVRATLALVRGRDALRAPSPGESGDGAAAVGAASARRRPVGSRRS